MRITIRRTGQVIGTGQTPQGDPESANAETRLYADNYRNLLLSGGWFGPVDGGIYNYLPVFLARLGASPSLVSLLTSGQAIIGIFAYIPGGAFTERYRDMSRLVVYTGLIARLAFLLIALLPWLFGPTETAVIISVTIVLWSLMAIPQAVHIPAFAAAIQKSVPIDQRARLNGTRWGLMSLTSGISIALFGLLLDRSPFPLGYQLVFVISFVAGALNLYYLGKVRVPPFVPEAAERSDHLPLMARLRSFFRPFAESRPFVRYSIASVAYRLTLALPIGLFSVFWVNELHATDTWIGLRGTAGYAALVVGYFLWGRIANRIGHRNLLLICGGGFAFYPVLTALAPSVEWLLPAAALWGFTAAGIDIGLFDMLLATSPEGKQPRFAAASNMLASIVTSVAPLLGAVLSQEVGIRWALLMIGGLQIIGTAFFLLLPGKEQEGLT
jgi:MFS family permease